jgi:expansin (peptidoglycan-binding protein)
LILANEVTSVPPICNIIYKLKICMSTTWHKIQIQFHKSIAPIINLLICKVELMSHKLNRFLRKDITHTLQQNKLAVTGSNPLLWRIDSLVTDQWSLMT